ncbi:hypothetical protein [Modicisalibacter coralii]|uniref:hypothetical protein n=1 Tax=Modicisalibacter coralii TaxID=2304602 RepID=UPI00100A63DB|nr:hypothetical protein [Halomonas coralii]
MLNRSRRVDCPACQGSNFWKGDPGPADVLHCRHCRAFITTYDDYIHDRIRREAAATLAAFVGARTDDELARVEALLPRSGARRQTRAA